MEDRVSGRCLWEGGTARGCRSRRGQEPQASQKHLPWGKGGERWGGLCRAAGTCWCLQLPFNLVGWPSRASGVKQRDVEIISRQPPRCPEGGRWLELLTPSAFQHQTENKRAPAETRCRHPRASAWAVTPQRTDALNIWGCVRRPAGACGCKMGPPA